MLALPLRHLMHHRLQLSLDRRDLTLDAFAFGRRKLRELLLRQGLAVVLGRQRQPRRRAQQGNTAPLGVRLQSAESPFVPSLEFPFDHLALGPVFLVLERRRQGGAQFLDEALHRRGEPGTSTGRQAEPSRLLRIGKIVDVAPVGWCRLALRLFAQQRLNLAVPAGAARPQRIDVVALAAHPHRQTDRVDRALLTDKAGRLFKFAAQRERQVGRRAAMAEERRRQWSSKGKSRAVDASRGCRKSVTATVLRRYVCHCRISRLPFINRYSYHSLSLSSSDIRQIPGEFGPRIAPSTAFCLRRRRFIVAQAGQSRRSRT